MHGNVQTNGTVTQKLYQFIPCKYQKMPKFAVWAVEGDASASWCSNLNDLESVTSNELVHILAYFTALNIASCPLNVSIKVAPTWHLSQYSFVSR